MLLPEKKDGIDLGRIKNNTQLLYPLTGFTFWYD